MVTQNDEKTFCADFCNSSSGTAVLGCHNNNAVAGALYKFNIIYININIRATNSTAYSIQVFMGMAVSWWETRLEN